MYPVAEPVSAAMIDHLAFGKITLVVRQSLILGPAVLARPFWLGRFGDSGLLI